jgi:hypothetical protein
MQMIMYIKIEAVFQNLWYKVYITQIICTLYPMFCIQLILHETYVYVKKKIKKLINHFHSKINNHENIPKYWSHSSPRIIRLLIPNQTFYNEWGNLFFIWLVLRVGPGSYVIAHHIWMTKYLTCPYWLTKT